MKATDVPQKFPTPFGKNCASADIRPIPKTTLDPNAASLDAGFPPPTLTPVGAGGVPPDGRDFNGLFFQDTAWARWVAAGAPIKYDAAFQADVLVGGYPQGAIVQSAVTLGLFFFSTADDNLTNPDTGGAGWTAFNLVATPGTGVYFQFTGAGSCQLSPAFGGTLWINGLNYSVGTGVNVTNSGLAASTFYYTYAYINAGAVVVEFSTTGPVIGGNGIYRKAGDPTRTWVGVAMTNASGQFQAQGVGTGSVFNRVVIALAGAPINGNTASTPPVEISAAARAPFISMGFDTTDMTVNAQMASSTAGGSVADYVGLAPIGGSPAPVGFSGQMYSAAVNQTGTAVAFASAKLTVGAYYATPMGAQVVGVIAGFNFMTVYLKVLA